MKKIIIWTIIAISILLESVSWAAQKAVLTDSTQLQQELYCPEMHELTRDGPWWRVGKIWKSYNESLVENIQEFSGAQWIGVKVGKIICLYKGKEKLTFPVALETIHPVLIPSPTGENWITTEGGYKKCISDNVKDCPFTQQKPADISNIYEAIKYQFKRQNDDD